MFKKSEIEFTMACSKLAIERAPELLGEKLSPTLKSLLCCECNYPIYDARQTTCGCRLCNGCYTALLDNNEENNICKKCGYSFSLNDTFKDRAVQNELKVTSFPCYHPQCPWTGANYNYRDHIYNCKYALVTCPNPECGMQMIRNELEYHLDSCPFKPLLCRWCLSKVPSNKLIEHHNTTCPEYKISCTAGCNEKIPRKELGDHLERHCTLQKRPCRFMKYGCHFKDSLDSLIAHYRAEPGYHLGLIEKALSEGTFSHNSPRKLSDTEDRLSSATQNQLTQHKNEITHKLNPISDGLLKLELKVGELQDNYQELVLLMQTLQATSYNGQFVWKIPEVSRRKLEAISGKTLSLYSAPFYTSRFGYKLCLRLYLNGDGSGKSSHISFFLTIMRGEYDALLPWPFCQMVTLMLLDQNGKKHIVQCFKPEPSSSSFWRPQSDMNIASGCPKFAPLSVLSDPSYVKDDTMFFKVLIDTSTLNQP